MADKTKKTKRKEINKTSKRFLGLLIVLGIFAVVIIMKAVKMKTVEKAYWDEVSSLFVRQSEIKPVRGEIISADGQVLVSTLPTYELEYEFVATDPDSAMRAK
ncbi:MAG: hypothetical protein HUK02_01185, partial [Bacteroidaceae bacterium]|nr:hypothetical protein [Bacteroidaceae bacterium]